MHKITNCLLFLVAALFVNQAQAALSPLSINGVPPVQFPPSDYNVTGIRLSALVGQQRDVSGLDFGVLGNITTGKFTGLAVSGLFNNTRGDATILGAQIAGLTNVNSQKVSAYGLQLAGLMNYQMAESKIVGLQAAIMSNYAPHTDVYGFQVGLYNKARHVYGMQLGLVNDCDNLHGIQIGLANFHRMGLFYVSPILNIGF